jgi:hypothetical protein
LGTTSKTGGLVVLCSLSTAVGKEQTANDPIDEYSFNEMGVMAQSVLVVAGIEERLNRSPCPLSPPPNKRFQDTPPIQKERESTGRGWRLLPSGVPDTQSWICDPMQLQACSSGVF